MLIGDIPLRAQRGSSVDDRGQIQCGGGHNSMVGCVLFTHRFSPMRVSSYFATRVYEGYVAFWYRLILKKDLPRTDPPLEDLIVSIGAHYKWPDFLSDICSQQIEPRWIPDQS
jgi:hypothetical protein